MVMNEHITSLELGLYINLTSNKLMDRSAYLEGGGGGAS